MAPAAKKIQKVVTGRPERVKLTAQESLERMEEFKERKEKFIATVREGKD
ncbi:MAG: hypothetical protein M3Y56_00260 [Armatimonadota bacterium]|nr:hypothetical protein [Armatimonadota bacterium]